MREKKTKSEFRIIRGVDIERKRARFIKVDSQPAFLVNYPFKNPYSIALSTLFHGERVERGRDYALYGAVINFEIKDNRVLGTVLGRDELSYSVELSFPTISAEDYYALTRYFGGSFDCIEQIYKSEELAIMLSHLALSASCTCPDRDAFCKHKAALLFVLAGVIESKPEILLSLYGIDAEKLLRDCRAEVQYADLRNDIISSSLMRIRAIENRRKITTVERARFFLPLFKKRNFAK